MKIEGPKSTRPVDAGRKTAKAKKASGPSFSSMLEAAADAEGTPTSVGPAAVGAVDALLAAQEAAGPPGEERDRRARRYGADILDRLEQIRTGLLLGAIPADRLQELADSMAQRKEAAADPQLAAIIEEIELRARVELAKFQRR